MNDRELIWVDKDFAEQWKALEKAQSTREKQEEVFNEYMGAVTDSVKREFRANLELLEEDAAIFTGLILKTKQAFEKAKSEHLNASYELWEKFEEELPSVKAKTEKIIATLKPLRTELEAINGLLKTINTHQIDRLFESVGHFANLYGKNKEMVDFLVRNFTDETINAALIKAGMEA